ncbi:hypothetical protein MKK69_01260 [Methylobacterium sp. J-026]|uniref:hypothetical protein n=1 Tax=Methylobacterium sp. J-026 TaxID=2836624 RepID=UPI001FBBFF47|nr:hypothetical protein [Methylobacterium sp. J-026]MCJ2132707.1 hypothetical protein [Methylobacterium sp. J-026]
MAPLNLSNPFRRVDAGSSLKRRSAALKSDLLNLAARPTTPNPLPTPGSPEAIEAWGRARSEFDRLTFLSEAEYAALRIGDSFTLWTTGWVKAAQRGDFTRFSTREMPVARAKTAAELADLLVITTRRDLRFAEAQRQTGIRELYALAYPDGEDPEPLPDPEPDLIHAAIAESYRAEDAIKAFGLDPASTSRPNWFLRERALTETQSTTRNAVWRTTPTTRAGRLALVDYARFQVALFTGSSVEDPDCPAYLFREIMGAVTAAFEADCAPASDTATHDLSGCDLAQLARLYETWESVFHHLTGASEIPCFTADRYSGHTPAGEALDREYDRAGAFLSDIAAEVRGRTAVTVDEQRERLGVLIRDELNTNGRPVNDALLAELNAQHER